MRNLTDHSTGRVTRPSMFRPPTVLLVLCLLAGPTGSLACSTVPGRTVDALYSEANGVVMAEVMAAHRTAQSSDPGATYAVETVTFKVLVSWKGPSKAGQAFATRTDIGPGSCGLTIDPTPRLLVATPESDLPVGSIWVIFLDDSSPHTLSSDAGHARIRNGAEKMLRRLYELSSTRRSL